MPLKIFTDQKLNIGDHYQDLFVVDIEYQVPPSILISNYQARKHNERYQDDPSEQLSEQPEIPQQCVKLGPAQLTLLK